MHKKHAVKHVVDIEVNFHELLKTAQDGSQLPEEVKISAAARNRARIQVHLMQKTLKL